MTFGRKYSWKPSSQNPGPGFYDSRYNMVESRSTSAVRMDKSRMEDRSNFLETSRTEAPDVTYNPSKPFGSEIKNKMHFGQRRESKLYDSPAPGQYECVEQLVRKRSKNCFISKTARQTDEHIVGRQKGKTPTMVDYNLMKPFGFNNKTMTLGGKYKDMPRRNGPSVGDYDPSHKLVKPSTKNVKIHEP